MGESGTQVTVKFTTRLAAPYKVSEDAITIPTTLTRYGMSQIINHMLSLETPRPFDFLIDNKLVRSSLETFFSEFSLSTESIVRIEYIPAMTPPKEEERMPHDEWIGAVTGQALGDDEALVVSGGYDGHLRFFSSYSASTSEPTRHEAKEAAVPLYQVAAHDGPITSIQFVTSTKSSSKTDEHYLVSTGKDRVGKLWAVQWSSQDDKKKKPSAKKTDHTTTTTSALSSSLHVDACSLVAQYIGSSDAVECCAINPRGDRVAMSSWDGGIRIYRTGAEAAVAARQSTAAAIATSEEGGKTTKKQRGKQVEDKQAAASSGGGGNSQLAPLYVIPGAIGAPGAASAHTQAVSALSWPFDNELYSASLDHTVRRWDVDVRGSGSAACVDTLHTARAVTCLAASSRGGRLVAYGGAERTLRIWDPRGRGANGEISLKGYSSHTAWISAVAWCPLSDYHVATGSFDGSVKIWDVRSNVPLATIDKVHEDKVLSLAWVGRRVVTGGADCMLKLHSIDIM